MGDADARPDELKGRLREIHPMLDRCDARPLAELESLADQVDRGTDAQRAFVDAVRSCLPARSEDPADAASYLLLVMDGDDILRRLSAPVLDLQALGRPVRQARRGCTRRPGGGPHSQAGDRGPRHIEG
uniref:hypothetical protein n=1 Tax=Methylobacterium sp. B34 TaxID=95563 RepID=UPI0016513187|nr:hypothetical protein [Methylobacterium sp. B34]